MSYSYGLNLTTAERIAKNVQDLLELRKGSVPYDRDAGVSSEWTHKNKAKYTAQMITEAEDMINEREDRAEVSLSLSDGEIIANIEGVSENG